MMSKKIPQDQPGADQPPNACPANAAPPSRRGKAEPGQRNGETASSSPESGSLNGDGKRGGKSRRRRKRSSHPAEGGRPEERPDKKPDPLVGLRAERDGVWLERGVYERAESLYQRWLVSSSNGTTQPKRSPPAQGKPPNSRPSITAVVAVAPPPSLSVPACHHGDQVACHHVVRAAWVNKASFDQAERRFVEESMRRSIPNSLDLPAPAPPPAPPGRPAVPTATPDEGYQSLAPTPATPVVQPQQQQQQQQVVPVVMATGGQAVNGLPRLPAELLRDVWLEKPAYDRAEAAFYQNLYGNNSSKRPGCSSSPSLVEEEEEEEEEVEGEEEGEEEEEEKRVVQPGKAEIFHALHPIQEEEEEPEEVAGGGGARYLLHPDSERVWLDKWRYDAAESHFHGYADKAAAKKKRSQRPEAEASSSSSSSSSSCVAPPLRDKYDHKLGE